MRALLTLAAIAGVVLFCLSGYAGLVKDVRDYLDAPGGETDQVTRYGARFEEVRKELPEHGTVGYRVVGLRRVPGGEIFPWDIGGGNEILLHPNHAYFWTQYTLAPVIVDRNREYPLTVVNRPDRVRLRREGDDP
jgi:hypothetical protein